MFDSRKPEALDLVELGQLQNPGCPKCDGDLEKAQFRDGVAFRCVRCDARYGVTTEMSGPTQLRSSFPDGKPLFKAPMPDKSGGTQNLGPGALRHLPKPQNG